MHLCLFEDEHVPLLRPLTETRAVFDLRLGMRTLAETAVDAFAPSDLVLHTRPLVAAVTEHAYEDASVNHLPQGADVLFLNGRLVADAAVEAIQNVVADRGATRLFVQNDLLVAAWIPNASSLLSEKVRTADALTAESFPDLPVTPLDDATLVRRPWHLLDTLRPALARDISTRTQGPVQAAVSSRPHATVHESAVAVHPDQVHLGDDATVRPGAILNAEEGPIFVGAGATIHEQAVIRGPCYVGPKSQIKVGANVEGCAFGYYCKVGGEVHDTIIHSLSNKAHPGFLGHAYLGQWCNLGADSNNSNLKNDYGEISAYSPAEEDFVSTGRQFAGLFMGDHSKCSINTMFNTGTVIGTCCNLYGGEFPPRYVPPFTWGGSGTGFSTFRLEKALEVAEIVMGRRQRPFTDADSTLLSSLFDQTREERDRHL